MRIFSFVCLAASVLLLASCGPDEKKPIVYAKGTNLYYADYTNRSVGMVDINTPGSATTIANASNGLDTISGIAIDFVGGKIYAAEELKNRIIRFNVDGSGTAEVLYDESDSVSTPTSITFHAASSTLYWANSGTNQLKKGSMDGSAAAESLRFNGVDSLINYCYGLVVDSKNEYIYYSDLMEIYNGGIWRGQLDGTRTPLIMFSSASSSGTVLRNPSSLCLDEINSLIYWADEGLKVISRGSYSTFASAPLYNYEDGIGRADGIALDMGNGYIYWTETSNDNKSGRIRRATVDGAGTPETVLDNVVSYSLTLKYE